MGPKFFILFVLLVISPLIKSDTRINTFLLSADRYKYEKLVSSKIADLLECDGHAGEIFKKFLEGNDWDQISKEDLAWLVPMLDAWGKIPGGILTGNIMQFGQFDECLSIGTDYRPNEFDVKGQYCTSAVTATLFKEITIFWAICIPDSCTLKNGTVIDDEENENVQISVQGAGCQNKNLKEFEWEDWVVTGCFAVLVGIILLGTIYEGYFHYAHKEPTNRFLMSFSLVTNTQKLFATSNAPGQIHCMHGIRAISLMWIIAGHRYAAAAQGLSSINLVQTLEFSASNASGYITSGRAAVDTFFLLSAFLVSFLYFKGVRSAIAKAEAKGSKHVNNPLTWARVPMFYVHRFLRILPAMTAVFLLNITIYKRIGEGPQWPLWADFFYKPCIEHWWSFFLFVQNYVNYKEMCVVPTWYLSADMQMYLLSPLVIIPLGELMIKGKKKLAYIIMCSIIVLCIVIPMSVEFTREFDVDNIYETHHRLSVYTIGLLFGMIVNDYTDKGIKLNPVQNLLLWGLAIGAIAGIVFTMHETEVEPNLEKNNLYFSLTRPIWSVALCWVVFACHFGYGGPINWLLSLPIFQVMTKLSFSMYLLHVNVALVLAAGMKYVMHFSEYETMYTWCGDYIFTIVVSIGWALCFESPIVGIEKILFGTGKRPAKPAEVVANVPEVKVEEPQSSSGKI